MGVFSDLYSEERLSRYNIVYILYQEDLAEESSSLLIHGIVDLIAQGKNVMFVSSKYSAYDSVESRVRQLMADNIATNNKRVGCFHFREYKDVDSIGSEIESLGKIRDGYDIDFVFTDLKSDSLYFKSIRYMSVLYGVTFFNIDKYGCGGNFEYILWSDCTLVLNRKEKKYWDNLRNLFFPIKKIANFTLSSVRDRYFSEETNVLDLYINKNKLDFTVLKSFKLNNKKQVWRVN